MQSVVGSLVIVGAHTPDMKCFWNGAVVPFIADLRVDWERDERRLKIKVSAPDPLHDEMRAAGINVKIGGSQ